MFYRLLGLAASLFMVGACSLNNLNGADDVGAPVDTGMPGTLTSGESVSSTIDIQATIDAAVRATVETRQTDAIADVARAPTNTPTRCERLIPEHRQMLLDQIARRNYSKEMFKIGTVVPLTLDESIPVCPEPNTGAYWPSLAEFESFFPRAGTSRARLLRLRPYEQYAVAYVASACLENRQRSFDGFKSFVGGTANLTAQAESNIGDLAHVSEYADSDESCARPFLFPASGAETKLAALLVGPQIAAGVNLFLRAQLAPIIEGRAFQWMDQSPPKPPLVLSLCCREVDGGWQFSNTSSDLESSRTVPAFGQAEDVTLFGLLIDTARVEIASLE